LHSKPTCELTIAAAADAAAAARITVSCGMTPGAVDAISIASYRVRGMTFLAFVFGLAIVGLGVSIALDFWGFGTKALRLSLRAAAPPWISKSEPSIERVSSHRVSFGWGVTLVGVVVVVVSFLSLA
jgi:hypothetical protein